MTKQTATPTRAARDVPAADQLQHDQREREAADPKSATPPNGAGTALAEAPSNDVATPVDYGEEAGAGLEGVSQAEQLVPFLRILQSNSPQVVDQTIEGARAGLILNTATGELYDRLSVVGVRRDHNFVKYTPRDQGGGFVGLLPETDPVVTQLRAEQGRFGKLKMEGGQYELVETFYLYVIAWDEEELLFPAVMGFASTQIKKYQSLVTRLTSYQSSIIDPKRRPPLWATQWRVGTRGEQNKKGKFFGWTFDPAGKTLKESLLPRSDHRYQAALGFYQALQAGQAKAAHESQTAEEAAGAEGDENIPY